MQVYRETLRVNLDRVVVPFPKEGISDFVRPLDLHLAPPVVVVELFAYSISPGLLLQIRSDERLVLPQS